MTKLTKKRKEISSNIDLNKVYKLDEAVDIIKLSSNLFLNSLNLSLIFFFQFRKCFLKHVPL